MANEKIVLQVDLKGNAAEQINKAATATTSLKAELRSLTQELQNLEPGSARFQELTQRAGELKDQIQDTNAAINATAGSGVENLAKGITGLASTGIAAFQGIASAQALFGVESEALQETLVRLQALAGLSSALESLGSLGDTMTNVKAAFAAAATQLGFFTVAKEADVVVTGAQVVATEGATVAQTGLNVAMLANPVFLLVAGIGALIAAFTIFGGKSKEAEAQEKKRKAAIDAAAKAQKEEASEVAKSSTEFVGLIYQLKNSNIGSKERKNLMDQINSTYGLTLKNMSTETDFQKQLNGEVQNYITFQRNKHKLKQNEAYFTSALEREEKATQDLLRTQRSMVDHTQFAMTKSGEFVDTETKKVYTMEQLLHGFTRANGDFFDGFGAYSKDIKKLQGEVAKANSEMESLAKRRAQLSGEQNKLTDSGEKYVDQEEKNRKAEEARQNALDKKNKRIQEAKDRQDAYNQALTAYYDLLEKNRQEDLVGREKALQEIANTYDEQIAIADKAGKSTVEITARYQKQITEVNNEWDAKELESQEAGNTSYLGMQEAFNTQLTELEVSKRQSEIDLMAEGADKVEAQAKLNYEKEVETLNKSYDDKIKVGLDNLTKLEELKNKELEFEGLTTEQKLEIENTYNARKIEIQSENAIIESTLKEQQAIDLAVLDKKYKDEELLREQALVQQRADTYSSLSGIIKGLRMEESGWLNDLTTTGLDAIAAFTTLSSQKFEKLTEKVSAYAQAIGGTLTGIVSAMSEANQSKLDDNIQSIEDGADKEKEILKAQYDNGLILKDEYEKGVKDLDSKAKDDADVIKKKAFETDKKFKIASALIAGVQGAIQAFTGAMSLGPIAGPIVGGILAGAVAAMTAINIAKIKATKFEGGGDAGGAAGGGVSTGGTQTTQATAPTPPSLSLFGQALPGSEGMGQQAAGMRQQTIRAVVVESDITGTQNRLSNYQQRAEVG